MSISTKYPLHAASDEGDIKHIIDTQSLKMHSEIIQLSKNEKVVLID